MQYIAYISLAFICLQLINALLNFIFRQPIDKTCEPNQELISVLIPARNEAKNIGRLLDSLQIMTNCNIEIIVCNDQSEDNTADIVKQYAQQEQDKRIRLIESEGLPIGWQGKNHACHLLAQNARGSYFLFLDADVRLTGNILVDATNYLREKQLGLLSIFPRQLQQSTGERLTVPIMNYILLSLLPLILVKVSPFSSHSAANGQFMLFDAKTYNYLHPHERLRSSVVEDIQIARLFKKNRIKTACINSEKRVQCRMYKSYREALAGFSKNIFMFFGNKPVLAFLFWCFATLGWLPVAIAFQQLIPAYLTAVVLILILYSATCKQSILCNLLLFPGQLFFLLHVMIRALIVKTKKEHTWKGRNIY